ncbi:MAG TPA: phage baseplate assembly protein V [Methanoregulaceae archaeon]|nr:phage baseplate assembly protein V [Methanoregulaceae archaeon]
MGDADLERLVIDLHQRVRGRYFGKFRGTVTDDGDPHKKGQVRAHVPEVFGTEESPWAMPAVPYAGKSRGMIAIPKKGDGIWIEFEAGDISRPIWSGCWWADNEKEDGGETMTLMTSGGHKIVLDDEKNEIRIIHAGGAEIALTTTDITLKASSGQVVISAAGVNVNNGTFLVK